MTQALQRSSLESSIKKLDKTYTVCQEAADQSFTPGPGAYNVNESFMSTSSQQQSFTMSPRLKQINHSNNVGPGQYEHGSSLNKISFSFRCQNRPNLATTCDNTPKQVGPGTYEQAVRSPSGFSLSGRFSTGKHNQTPGPGTYEIDIQTRQFKATLSGRPQKFMNMYSSAFKGTPEPGLYDVDIQNKERKLHGTKFGTSQRTTFTGNNNPGPGAYEFGLQKRSSSSFSLSGRVKGHTL